MQQKFSKHFIYNWLREDLYGECLIFKSYTFFGKKGLDKIWAYMSFRKNVQRSSIVGLNYLSAKAQFFTNKIQKKFSLISNLRTKQLLKNLIVFNQNPAAWYFTLRKLNCLFSSKYFFRTFPHDRYRSLSKKSRTPRVLKTKQKPFTKRLRPRVTSFELNKYKKVFRWCIRRRTPTLRRLRLLSSPAIKKFTTRRLNVIKNQIAKANSTEFTPVRFKKSKRRLKKFPRKLNFFNRKKLEKSRGFFKRLLKSKGHSFHIKRWRLSNFLSPTHFLPNTHPIFSKTVIHFNFYNSFWDKLAYKFKRILFWNSQHHVVSRAVSKSKTKVLDFKDAFKRQRYVVRKNQLKSLLFFRLLNYFQLVQTSYDFKKVFQPSLYEAKKYNLPLTNIFEFRVVTVLMRANFLDNGYTINSLLKRGCFLINGIVASINLPLQVWDVVTVAAPLWWVVYARFFNFFKIFLHQNSLWAEAKTLKVTQLPKLFLKAFFKLKYFFRKSSWWSKKRFASTVTTSKNLILTLPPSYLEVSYKLFIIIFHKLLTTKPSDITAPLTLSGVKSLTLRSPHFGEGIMNNRIVS